MKFTRTALLGVAAAAIAGTAVFAAGHANVEGAIKARKAQMQLNAFNLGILGNMAKGAVEFDAEAAQRAANNLNALAMMDTTDLWPAGSSASDVEGTRALSVMWETYPEVLEKAAALQTATEALAADAGSIDAVRAGLGAIGGACGACHEAYRQSN